MRNDKLRAAVRLDLTNPLLADIENWRRSQAKIPSRTDAIRQLVKRALVEESETHATA
jgi:hypothetical protein